MYKQVPKGTSKMEILSRNLISISIAQKVPACISKQLPPFNNEISNKPFQHLLPVQKKTMMAKYHQTFPSSVAQPQQSRAVLRGQHVLGSTAHPGLAMVLPGRENWSNWTGESLPQG